MSKSFDIEKCTVYTIEIAPEEMLYEPGEGNAWINPVDEALDSDEQWDGSMRTKFTTFLDEMGWYELQEGLFGFDENNFDKDKFVSEAKARGFTVKITHHNIE